MEIRKNQAPGYFRYMLGRYEITSLYDGYVVGDASIYLGQDEKKTEETWKNSFSDTFVKDGKLFTKAAVNTFLVNTGNELILIDAGAKSPFYPKAGLTTKNMALSGYQMEDVTMVLITHLHPDHVNGLTVDGNMVYPNAIVYINQADFDFWMTKNPNIKAILEPYINKKQCKLFLEGDEISDGIKPIPLPGHTVGHTGYEITSDDETIFFWGDIVHDSDVQFSNMDVEVVLVDRDEIRIKRELKTAKETVEKVVKERKLVGGAHMPFPGIGHLAGNETGTGYRWIPVHYREIE